MAAPLLAGIAARSGTTRLATNLAKDSIKGLAITLDDNIGYLQMVMDNLGKNQLPFAMAQTLNDAAFEVRQNTIKNTWGQGITERNTNFIKSVMMPIKGVNRATKKNLRAIVQNYPDGPRHRDYLQRLAVGGVKTPQGNNLTIPARDLKLRPRGGVTKANRPRQLLNRKNVFKQTISRTGQPAIFRRATKDRYPLQILYVLEPSGSVRKQFDFYDDANAKARYVMQKNFKKNYKRAVSNAKKRR